MTWWSEGTVPLFLYLGPREGSLITAQFHTMVAVRMEKTLSVPTKQQPG